MCKGEGGLPPFTFTALPLCIILTHCGDCTNHNLQKINNLTFLVTPSLF